MNAVAAMLVAFCVSVMTATSLAFAFSGLHPAIATVALSAGAVAGMFQYVALRRAQPNANRQALGLWDWLTILAFSLFSLRAFCWLVFQNEDQIEFISPNNLGDLALHLTYIKNLANGVPFWPENPIFAGVKIHYPLGVDLFNSVLTLAGVDVYRGLVWVGLAGCLFTGIALFKWGRSFALAGFLFNGGLAGFVFFKTFQAEDFQAALAWKSIPLAIFVTQRGMLYAVPAGLVLLWSWRERLFSSNGPGEKRPLPLHVEVLLYSTMPLFHLHTFIFLSLLLGCWFLFLFARWFAGLECLGIKHVFRLIAWSLVPATILILLITGSFKSGSMVHLPADWTWMYGEQPQFAEWATKFAPHFLTGILGRAACWTVNFGVFPPLVGVLVYKLIRQFKTPSLLKAGAFVIPSALIFIFSCSVMLAPWEWDNTKIMIWPYFTVLPFLWEHLIAKWNVWLRGACCFALWFSGFISLLGGIDGSHTGYDLARRSELNAVAAAVRQIPPTAIFAGVPTYDHPLLLNGRNMVAGYTGHLWSHGVDYEDQVAALESVLNGDADWQQTASDLRARYIFWGRPEEKAYPKSSQPWKQSCPKVAEGAWGSIYDLRNSLPKRVR
jgi:hypothetical protein